MRSKDSINWRRRVKASIQETGIDLIGIKEAHAEGSSSLHLKLFETNIKWRTTIILLLEDGLLACASAIIDNNEKTAEEL